MSSPLRVALGEYDTGWHDPSTSLARATALIESAGADGADLIAFPEMCTTGFTMEAARYSEPLDGPSASALAAAARRAGVHVIAGMPTRASSGGEEKFYNSAIVFSPAGARVAEYRKQKLFSYAAENGTYSAGTAPVTIDIKGVRVTPLICFELRFPELFRSAAPTSDCIIVIANWPSRRQSHWETLLRARAIETQAYVVGVNRTGRADDLDYSGGSLAFDPWGEPLAPSGQSRIVTIDPAIVALTRRTFPLVLDQR